jgi:hypothetical protein
MARPVNTCSVAKCPRKVRARGYCHLHYMRWWQGRPIDGPPQRRTYGSNDSCEADNCSAAPYARGFCPFHYQRFRRFGSTDAPPPRVPRCGTRAGARRHRQLGSPVCAPCLRAERKYQREHKRRSRGGVTFPRVLDERITITGCVVDILETFWPEWLTTDVLVARVLDRHPEWSAESVFRLLKRDVRADSDYEPGERGRQGRWRASAPSWERTG